jgi:hypothetical protein
MPESHARSSANSRSDDDHADSDDHDEVGDDIGDGGHDYHDEVVDTAGCKKVDDAAEDEDEDSFATCSSDLSSKKPKSPSVQRSRHSRTRSPMPVQQQQQQQQVVEEVKKDDMIEDKLKDKVELENWDSADLKTEVEVSDIEEEEDIPDIEALAEPKVNELSKLVNGESPRIVSRYLARIEREKSETESEDESFEAFRAMRMRTDREAAPPERDINEDDTETAEFQTKLRQLGSNPSSASTTHREAVNGGGDHSSCEATTPDVSAATLSTDRKDETEEERDQEIVRSRSQEIYLQRKNFVAERKKFNLMRANQDLEILKEKPVVGNHVEEEDEEKADQVKEELKPIVEIASKPINEVKNEVFREENKIVSNKIVNETSKLESEKVDGNNAEIEDRPSSTDGQKKESASSSTNSLHSLRHSRSFDSGLPMSPEVRRRLKTISQRSPSELSLSVFDKRKSFTATPSPGRQSIEDLASSVENLREKLSLFPFARTGKQPVGDNDDEELDQVPQMMSLQGGLTRSRSWQGFGAAHRTARHQAFWENQRYEQVTDKDLSLPPPPASKPPETCLSVSNVSLSDSNQVLI